MKTLAILETPRLRQVLTVLFLLGALACMFPPESYLMKWWMSHAEQIVLGYLMLGLFFLVVNNSRLMFVSFGCSAAISFFLNEKANGKIKDADPNDAAPVLHVAHFNVSNSGGQAEEFLQAIASRQADVVSLQEITPDWDSLFRARLASSYPYFSCISGLNNGIALFSKVPMRLVDTFYYQDSPNLAACIRPKNFDTDIWIIGSYIRPPLSGTAFESLKAHLERISFYANRYRNTQAELPYQKPVITVGDYNTVSWSAELIDFREATELSDIRRGLKPTAPDGKFPLFNVPVEHIFYSTRLLDCIAFDQISTPHSSIVGIEAKFQPKKLNRN